MNPFEEFLNAALWEPLRIIGENVLAMLPNFVGMVAIMIVGIVAAWLAGQLVERVFRVLRGDHLCQRFGLTAALARGGVKSQPSAVVGKIVLWVVLTIFVVLGLAVLHLEPVNTLTISLLGYIPYFFTAVFIILIGFLLSNFFSQAVLIAAVNAGLPPARLLASFTRWGIQLVALAMALEQLGIAENIVVVGFGITFGGVVLASAIAFGLGAKDLAKEFLEQRFSQKSRGSAPDDLRHL